MPVSILALALLSSAMMQNVPEQQAPPADILRLMGGRQQTPEEKAKQQRRFAAGAACRRAFIGQDYIPQPSIWRISDGDTKMYLFGTIHLLPVGFDWRSEQLNRIIAEAQLLITETGIENRIDFAGLDSVSKEAEGQLQKPIAARVKGDRRAKWLGMAAVLPEDMVARLDRMPDWLAAFGISVAAMSKTPPLAPGADEQLHDAFKLAGKPVIAIEDGDSLAQQITRMPATRQRQMLNEALDAVGKPDPLETRMARFHRWAKGEHMPGAVWTMRQAYGEDIRQLFLINRNRAWARVIAGRMEQPGTVLVAVGAGHFDGHTSLLTSLADLGLHAERISSTTSAKARTPFLPKPGSWGECSDYMFGQKEPQQAGE